MSSSALLVMHAIRLRGIAPADAITTATQLSDAAVLDALAALRADGLVTERAGRMPGFTLTADGKARHAQEISDELSEESREQLSTAYAVFLPVNADFKQVCTDWQLRPAADATAVANDHLDQEYDKTIIANLRAIFDRVTPILAAASSPVPRFRTYQIRLAAALGRVEAGDRAAFARPLNGSFHDVWMEIHEDFLLSLGRARGTADGH